MTQSPPPPPRRTDIDWARERLIDVDEYIARIDSRAEAIGRQAADPQNPHREAANEAFEWDRARRAFWVKEREELLRKIGAE